MTGRAWGLVVLGAASIAAGMALRWPEFIAVGATLLVLLLMPLAIRRPRGATWNDVSSPVRVVRNNPAAVVIDVTVAEGSTRWVSAVDEVGRGRVFLPEAIVGAAQPVAWPIDTSRRGLFHVGPARLEVGDPFGISRRVLATRQPSPVLVVPRVHYVPSDAMVAATDAGDSGERAGSETFQSLREYVVGDPMKTIHWRSSARAGKLMVKRMVDTTMPWLLVVLDVNARAYDREGALFEDFDSPAFEESVDTAASWAWHGCTTQQRVLLTTTSLDSAGPVLAAEVTVRTRESALDALAVVEPLASDLCGAGRVAALTRRQGIGRVVLVTGRRTDLSSPWVASWRSHLPVTVIVGHG